MLKKNSLFFVLCCGLAFGVGCGDDDGDADTGTDTDVPDTTATDTDGTDTDGTDTNVEDTGGEDGGEDMGTDTDVPPLDPTCENYCTQALADCAGDPAAYNTMTECMTWCEDVGEWDAGTAGDEDGNTIACRMTAIAADNCNAGGFTGGDVCGSYCMNYCNNLENTCRGSDEVYENTAACMTACEDIDTDGVDGTTAGDSIQCRIYHGGIPANMMPETHCNHAGPTGLDADGTPVCAFDDAGFDFNEDDAEDFTQFDRMGMPAVSTALAGEAANAYNDGTPTVDATGAFVPTVVANLTAVHTALDDDIGDISPLAPCSMDPSDPEDEDSLPVCLAQAIDGADGPAVASFVVPDTITVDPTADAGFPNGRLLTDPVIDVTLAIILLDLTVEGNTATTLATAPIGPLNPPENDAEFSEDFPYLAPLN